MIISRPVRQIIKMIPTMAERSRDWARYSSETLLGILPAADATRISAGIVMANIQASDMIRLCV
jgi:hypothetical protein